MRRLAGKAWLEHALVHPHVVAVVLLVRVLAVLPVRPPPAVGAVGDVDDALGLTLVIAVVVDADQVAELVERELLQVADAGSVDFEIRSVGLRAHDRALIRIRPALAALVGDVEADVPDLPVDPAIRSCGQTRDAVAAECRVRAVAFADHDLAIDRAVAVVVLEPPHSRRRSDEHVAAVPQQAAGDVVGRIGVEAPQHDLRRVGNAVAVGVLDAVEPFLQLDEVTQIVRAVLVEVWQPLVLRAARRRQLPGIEVTQVRHCLQRVDRRHPRRMIADVERHVVAARARRVERPGFVEFEGDGIDDELIRGPELELEVRRDLDVDALAGLVGGACGIRGAELDVARQRLDG